MKPWKTITILGPDRTANSRLAGSLLYKCGLNDLLVEQLRQEGKQSFHEIPAFLKDKGRDLVFETAKYRCQILDEAIKSSEILLLIPEDISDAALSHQSVALVQASESTSVLAIYDFSTRAEWSHDKFKAFRETLSQQLLKAGQSSLVAVVPVSTTHSINILDHMRPTQWSQRFQDHNDLSVETLIETIDSKAIA